MPGHPELRKLADLAAGKQIGQMRTDHAGQRQKQLVALFSPPARHVDQARQHARHLDDGDFVFTAKRVMAAEPDDEIQRFVGHLRKRVRRIESDWHQQRPHGAFKISLHPAPLHRVALAMRNHADAVLCKRRKQFVVVRRVLARHHVVRHGRQGLERRDRTGAFQLVVACRREMRHRADFKKFVQVGRHDA